MTSRDWSIDAKGKRKRHRARAGAGEGRDGTRCDDATMGYNAMVERWECVDGRAMSSRSVDDGSRAVSRVAASRERVEVSVETRRAAGV